MFTILILVVLGDLLVTALFIGSRWKRARIRRTGTLVRAQVTDVQTWQDTPRADFSHQTKILYFLGARRFYEIRAEWTDPYTKHTCVFTSGVKQGVPAYQQGDSLDAYVSPNGNYLKLS